MIEASRRDLLPAGLDKLRWLFWLFVLPQLVLLAIQFYQWELVSGEMNPSQQGKAITFAGPGLLRHSNRQCAAAGGARCGCWWHGRRTGCVETAWWF
jgi:hypothetical protein